MVWAKIIFVAILAVGVLSATLGYEGTGDRVVQHEPMHPGDEPPCTNFFLC